ncbi:MAG: bifunctional nuclease family protein [bacterium]|jgi:bifunctional DNase/RNase
MIHVKVAGLSLSNLGFVVLLKGDPDPRSLPIFIGGAEAQSIALWLEKVQIPRPLTHDLFKNVLDCMECRLMRVVIKDVVESTYYAVLVLERDGIEIEIDARPSDAIALGLRCSAPLYVTAQVMNKAGVVLEEGKDGVHEEKEDGKEPEVGVPKKNVGSPLALLKAKLEKAISVENYEDAAKFRDEIKRYEQAHGKN